MVGSAKAHPFSLNAQHTGERTSSDIYDIMPAYLLWNLYGEFRFPQRKKTRKKKCTTCDQEITLNEQIYHLFGTDYLEHSIQGETSLSERKGN